jgi:uncharacterized protein YijF (DUF1287 family)
LYVNVHLQTENLENMGNRLDALLRQKCKKTITQDNIDHYRFLLLGTYVAESFDPVSADNGDLPKRAV